MSDLIDSITMLMVSVVIGGTAGQGLWCLFIARIERIDMTPMQRFYAWFPLGTALAWMVLVWFI